MENINLGVDYEKLLDWIEYEIGLTREKATEYVNLIIKINGWALDDGKIVETV